KHRPALGHRLIEHRLLGAPARVAVAAPSDVLVVPSVRGVAHAPALEASRVPTRSLARSRSPDARPCWLARRPPVAAPPVPREPQASPAPGRGKARAGSARRPRRTPGSSDQPYRLASVTD